MPLPPTPNRLTQIDASVIDDHAKLTEHDQCYFWREYTSGKGWSFSTTNQLITNLKKKPSQASGYELSYKRGAIAECARFYRGAISEGWLSTATLVPVPGSKIRGHTDFDDRQIKICRSIRPGLDVRELVVQTESTVAAHEAGGVRPTVAELLAIYEINEDVAKPAPTRIAVFDDVLTAGVHFRAMTTILEQRFPGVPIVGFFVARRIFATPEESDLDD